MENSEKCLMGIVLNNPELFEKLNCHGNIFTGNVATLYDILDEINKKYKGFDKNTILDFISNDRHYSIADFYDIYESEYDESKYNIYLSNVMTKNIKNNLKKYVPDILNNDYKSYEDIKIELDKMITEIYVDENADIKDMKENCKRLLEDIHIEKEWSSIPFIDDEQGGFSKDEYVIIGARPSVGKTSYAISMIINKIRNGSKVGFFSAEMLKDKITRIMACSIAGINPNDMDKNVLKENETNRLIKSLEHLYDSKLYIDDKARYIEDIVRKAKLMKRKYDIDIIFIDYIQYLRVKDNSKSSYERLLEISNECKNLNKELNIPVVVLAQLNRGSLRTDRPYMSDIKGCGDIEQDADIVVLLHTESMAIDNNAGKRLVKFYVDKNRNGKVGDYTMEFNVIHRRFVKGGY